MLKRQFEKMVLPVAALVVILVAGMLVTSPRGLAQSAGASFDPARVEQGLDIAPVKLTYPKEYRNLVGFGSWLVNAVADCNGCHTSGTNGTPYPYAVGFNPYFGQHPTKVDPTVYLAGGDDFGQVAVDPVTFAFIGPHIISRNLTPDYTGRPEGGNTFEQFLQIIRHGTDFDHLHPPCSTAPSNPNCLLAIPGNEVDGNLLQVMPWPTFNNMSTDDLLAIYTYLSAIPCITGPATAADLPPASQYAFKVLHNDCTPPTK
jgi:hypothetical protein